MKAPFDTGICHAIAYEDRSKEVLLQALNQEAALSGVLT
jgi:hypothetical protein